MLILGGGLLVAWQFRREGDRGAAARLLATLPWLALPWAVAGWAPGAWTAPLGWSLLALTGGVGVILLAPTGGRHLRLRARPTERIDERDTMFSRATLEPGTERFRRYYERRPEQRPVDDAWRASPGLLDDAASLHHPLHFAAARATFRDRGRPAPPGGRRAGA